jgi:hypothetical protein
VKRENDNGRVGTIGNKFGVAYFKAVYRHSPARTKGGDYSAASKVRNVHLPDKN